MRSARAMFFVILLGGVLPSCYHTRVLVPEPTPATEYEKRTVHCLFWGLVQENVRTDDCLSNAIDEVRVSTNFGYQLVSVATLGIWVPIDIEWRCAKDRSVVPPDSL